MSYAAASCVAAHFVTSALVRYLQSTVIEVPHLEHAKIALPLSSFSGVADQVCGGHCCVICFYLHRLGACSCLCGPSPRAWRATSWRLSLSDPMPRRVSSLMEDGWSGRASPRARSRQEARTFRAQVRACNRVTG